MVREDDPTTVGARYLAEAGRIADALEVMKRYRISGVPVTKNGKLVGILTNRDLERLRRVSWGDFLATTLPNGGTIGVYVDGRLRAKIGLASATTALPVPVSPRIKTVAGSA